MSGKRLAANLKGDISTHHILKEVAEMLVYVRQEHLIRGANKDMTADGETIMLETVGSFKGISCQQVVAAPARMRLSV